MIDFILPGIISFIAIILSIYPTIKFAKKYHLVDDPDKRPHPAHIHKTIIPRAGGLACFIGLTAAILIFIPIEQHILGLLTGLFILLITGLLDDRLQNFSPYLRLLIQTMVAFLVVGSGVGISFITNPLGGILRLDSIVYTIDFLGTHNLIILADMLALIWIVWVMNMINWAKGVDGQMPGIALITSLFLGLLSVKLFLEGDINQFNIAKLSFITAGAAAGFLFFNWSPAKIMPGQSGSTIFGLMIATLSILSGAKLATAGLVLLIPATDFVYTFFRRILQRKSPVWGDRGHLHHKLFDEGWSARQISLFYMLGGAILGTVALNLDSRGKLFAALLISTTILGGILWLNFFSTSSKQQDPDSG